jgi:hypothetical protein
MSRYSEFNYCSCEKPDCEKYIEKVFALSEIQELCDYIKNYEIYYTKQFPIENMQTHFQERRIFPVMKLFKVDDEFVHYEHIKKLNANVDKKRVLDTHDCSWGFCVTKGIDENNKILCVCSLNTKK